MNSPLYKYSIIRYQPNIERQEVINIGTVIFSALSPFINVLKSLHKVFALDPNYSAPKILHDIEQMQAALNMLWESGMSPDKIVELFTKGQAGLTITPLGYIESEGKSVADVSLYLQKNLVTPPAKKRQKTSGYGRLNTELRAIFRRAKILGKDANDIRHHKVVPHFPIDEDVGLYAEFALRNGKLHITETIDFRSKDKASKKREAEAKTLLLLQAKEIVGSDLKRYVVVSGVDHQVQSSLNLLERHADEFIVRENTDDWSRFINGRNLAASVQ